ncbi:GguC protein [Dyadobacter luteus]|uniref:GguC protein n=1 Tax=Dyadobacter luteus TaxID=2259619 RepID=A0A3D8Y4K0_9BACT|nr:AraD1 family protein [Dyadobacter luteus]REA57144.1 GguC protein [Dyadobacter luteus]
MENKIRVVQISHHTKGRAIAIVEEPSLVLVGRFRSVYEAALEACRGNISLKDLLLSNRSDQLLHYDSVYEGQDAWKLLPAFDVPENPFACLVAGTGLTHRNSALNRQMMHGGDSKPSDSIIMYEWGVNDGFPEKGQIGVQPEWFYKGNGSVLRAHGEALEVPAFANDGGEEPEIAGVYVVDGEGNPRRVGFASGNEFSDHVMEKKNYLYLAPSKLRQCAIGPELVIGGEFTDIKGTVSVSTGNSEKWSSSVKTGESNMAHSLENLEYHHFKYPGHRIPLQGHVHFFGADAFSFGNQVLLESNDLMTVHWEGMGRALKNPISVSNDPERIIAITQL